MDSNDIDTKRLRATLAAFATGVTVVTVGGPSPHGMTANSFTAVSLTPPMVLVCVERDAMMHGHLAQAGVFAVSVLSAAQEETARYFADRCRPLGQRQFDDVGWTPGSVTGAPLITGSLAHFECEVWRGYDGGDHTIFLGLVRAMHRDGGDGALLFVDGRFGRTSLERSDVTT